MRTLATAHSDARLEAVTVGMTSDGPVIVTQDPSGVVVRDLGGQEIDRFTLSDYQLWPTRTLLLQDRQLVIANREGTAIYSLPSGTGETSRLLWQGRDFSQLELVGLADLDGDGLEEIITRQGAIFAQQSSGGFGFVCIDDTLRAALAQGWRPQDGPGPEQLWTREIADSLAVARWHDGGLHVIDGMDTQQVLGSLDYDGDGHNDLILTQSEPQGSGVGLKRRTEVVVLSGIDLHQLAYFSYDIPLPDTPYARELSSYGGGALIGDQGELQLMVNLPLQGNTWESYHVLMKQGRDPQVKKLPQPLSLPGLFSSGGPTSLGMIGHRRWIAVGPKHNSNASVSLLQISSRGEPLIQELSLTEYGLHQIGSLAVGNLDGDGSDELVVNAAGQLFILEMR